MAHTTTCSACGTTFRVTAEQLLAHHGDVRCGRCGKVFSAHDTLTLSYPPPSPELEEPPPIAESLPVEEFTAENAEPSAPPPVESEPLFDEAEPIAEEPTVVADAAGLVEESELPPELPDDIPASDVPSATDELHMEEFIPSFDQLPASPDEPIAATIPSAEEALAAPLAEAETASEMPAPEVVATDFVPPPTGSAEADHPEFDRLAAQLHAEAIAALAAHSSVSPVVEPPPVVQEVTVPPVEVVERTTSSPFPGKSKSSQALPRWLMPAASLVLLGVLFLQGMVYFRTELVAYRPAFRPLVEQLCSGLGCAVTLPQNPDLLSIETSALEAVPGRAGIVVLSAILRNRATYAQSYPLFELTLTDYQDKLAARRIFPPQEYLPKDAVVKNGMPANEEIDVKLHLDLGELQAAGYRVYLFYSATTS